MVQSSLSLGLSPCPNDTFIFHALLHGLAWPDDFVTPAIEPYFADVEKLNAHAMQGDFPFTKVSAGVLPHVLDKYRILASGGALGFGCGPLLVARTENFDPQKNVIAIPGRHTTAALLLDMFAGKGRRVEMLFSDIMPAVARDEVDAGVIIHEGRFTYGEHGLCKVADLGEWWENEFGLPLPLGVILARRDSDREMSLAMQAAIGRSIDHARAHPQTWRPFVRAHASELADAVIDAHIQTFVTDFSRDLGTQGRAAILRFLAAAEYVDANERDIFV